ncbi:hypothetical protein D3C78_1445150 [compost metagenome]
MVITVPTAFFVSFIRRAVSSLITKPAVSETRAEEKSRPSLIVTPIVLTKSWPIKRLVNNIFSSLCLPGHVTSSVLFPISIGLVVLWVTAFIDDDCNISCLKTS